MKSFGKGRAFLGTLLAAALIAAAQLASAPEAAAQAPRQLKKVRIAVGTSVLNVSYPWLMMPLALNYWREEGLDVEVLPVGASLQAVQQMVGGNAEFGQVNSSVIIQSNVVNNIPLRVVMANGVIDWAVAVLDGGPIKNVKDLKGKTVGVFSLASGGIPFLKSFLRANGLNPDVDIQMVAVGFGAPALEALRSNKVQALMFWAAANALFENQGAKLRYFRGSDWKNYPDFTLATLAKTIQSDPAMVESIARGAAKATVFALANPDCVRRIHWTRWPATKPSGADEATLVKWDMNNLKAQLDTLKDAFEQNGGKLWGNATPEGYGKMQDFMAEAKLIDRKLPASTYMVGIAGFYERINKFDQTAIRAQAVNCPIR